jgi:hypothetical protein
VLPRPWLTYANPNNELHQAEAARASAAQLRRVAPLPVPAAVQAPGRPRNAADLAAMSFARKPGKVRPYKAPAKDPKLTAPSVERDRRRREQGRAPGLS